MKVNLFSSQPLAIFLTHFLCTSLSLLDNKFNIYFLLNIFFDWLLTVLALCQDFEIPEVWKSNKLPLNFHARVLSTFAACSEWKIRKWPVKKPANKNWFFDPYNQLSNVPLMQWKHQKNYSKFIIFPLIVWLSFVLTSLRIGPSSIPDSWPGKPERICKLLSQKIRKCSKLAQIHSASWESQAIHSFSASQGEWWVLHT